MAGQPAGGEEGYVHIHAGIHGIGNLDASARLAQSRCPDHDPEDSLAWNPTGRLTPGRA
jgi:hypothetical protein